MSSTNQITGTNAIRFDGDFTMTINGKAVTGATTFPVTNPATEEVFAYAPDCSPEEFEQVAAAAQDAFKSWSVTPIEERRRLILAVANAIAAHTEDLARLLTLESGKPLQASTMEIGYAADWLRRTTELSIPEETREADGKIAVTRHLPLGVVSAIPAWNFPIGLSAMKIAPALLTGNTIVLKQSFYTSLTILKIGELASSILPSGVFNVISSTGSIDAKMSTHPVFSKISYTGSTVTGRKIMAGAAATLKHLTLELGGNDPAIVMPDVDVEKVAQTLFFCASSNTGQLCIASKRIYVHEDIYDEFVATFVAVANSVKIGNGLDQGVDFGPLTNKPQYDRVVELIKDCLDNGYEILAGGLPAQQKGYFIPFTVIGNPPEGSRIVKEEQFGPITPIMKFTDVEDVIARANAVEYGLGGTVWCGDEELAFSIAERIESGSVWVNEPMHLAPEVPFGGRKQSGISVEGGVEGLLAFTVPQTVWRKK